MNETPAISGSTYASAAVDWNKMVGGAGNAAAINNGMALGRAQQFLLQDIKQEISKMATRRLVQVFIADPNENVPLNTSLLYSGEQKLTDATDQELFFEIDIKSILETYNAARVKIIDKKVKDRTEYLEPAKIRDLKMVVVTVAGF